MNQYQKVYMNQIHSSSLLGQLAQMWRSQMLCDALIKTGHVTTKAHRVVLVAACPMLQSMDNAAVGSHLEVRLAADIKQEAVNSFLQYLYEGFMMLTEDNVKDIEKVARLLQVDNVTKCCIDFYNCLQKKTGVHTYVNTQYKYSSADLLEFRHVRTTDLQKTVQERMMKRAAADSMRPTSPTGKRQRMQQQQQRPLSPNIDLAMFGQKADDTLSMAHSYMGHQATTDPWERVPRMGAGHRPGPRSSGVIEIVEDGLEILQTQPPDKDSNKSAQPVVQKSLAISVSSQLNSSTDVHVVNVTDSSSHPTVANDVPIMSTGRDTSITVSPLTVLPGSSSTPASQSSNTQDSINKSANKAPQPPDQSSGLTQRGLFPISMSPINQQNKKSFAAGSASQVANMSQDASANRPSSSTGSEIDRPPSTDSGKDSGGKSKVDDGSASNSTDMAPDLSLVKIEPAADPGLDMYVDAPVETMMAAQQREHEEESDLELEEASGDWSRDELSNEAAASDQNNSWYIGQFKGSGQDEEMVEDVNTLDTRVNSLEDMNKLDIRVSSLTGSAYRTYFGSGLGMEQRNYEKEFEHFLTANTNEALSQLVSDADNHFGTEAGNTDISPSSLPDQGTPSDLNNINLPGSKIGNGQDNEVMKEIKSTTKKKYKKRNDCRPYKNRLKYALRNSGGRTSRSLMSKTTLKKKSKSCESKEKQENSKVRKQGTSIVGKLVPAKNVTSVPNSKACSETLNTLYDTLQSPDAKSLPAISNLIRKSLKEDELKTYGQSEGSSTDPKTKFMVLDPKFWNIPLQSVDGLVNLPKNLQSLKYVSQVSGCLLPVSDTFQISHDAVTSSMKSSNARLIRFSMILFRKVVTVGEVYDCSEEKTQRRSINPVKLAQIRMKTFEKFHVRKDLEDFIWRHIIYGINSNIDRVNALISKWFDVSAILNRL